MAVMTQFFLNGVARKMLTGGSERPLSSGEKIFAGVAAGAVSSVVASPLELVMIQQQLKGGGLVSTAACVCTPHFGWRSACQPWINVAFGGLLRVASASDSFGDVEAASCA